MAATDPNRPPSFSPWATPPGQPGVDSEADGAGRGAFRGPHGRDRRPAGFRRGAAAANIAPALRTLGPDDPAPNIDEPIFVDLGHLDPKTVRRAVPAVEGGRFALANYSHALKMAARGEADAVCFTPFNKQAMRLAHPPYDDEISYSQGVIGVSGPASEFNVLDKLWNARVTSHVPLSEVASLITGERVLRGLELTDASMRAGGLCAAAHRCGGPQPARRRRRQFRARRDRGDRAGGAGGAGVRGSRRGPVPLRHGLSPRKERRLRRGADHVSRPGPDRDEADGVRSRRDRLGRLSLPDLHPGARHRLRHRRTGDREYRASRAAVLLAAEMARSRKKSAAAA
jgi:4-hydroxythreonine-4-phosphate dehydrogenase